MVSTTSVRQRVFVSHSSSDKRFCDHYVQGLRAHGLDVWYDEHNLGAGQLDITIGAEIASRLHFIVILSSEAVRSKWVSREIGSALALEGIGTIKSILPVVIEPCELPTILLGYKRIEGNNDEPITVESAVAQTVGALALAAPIAQNPPVHSSSAHLPARLVALGFHELQVGETDVIIPPLSRVPAGPFDMGWDQPYDVLAYVSATLAKPMHQFYLAEFAIGTYPVTVAEYECAVRHQAVPVPRTRVPYGIPVSWEEQLLNPDNPVVNVSWENATQYCRWLSGLTGVEWTLPTEAQWEKAARGTDRRLYPWGNDWSQLRANTRVSIRERGLGRLTPVGYFGAEGASPYGVQEMAGGVWEWCSSILKEYPYWPDDGREDPSAPGSRIQRGGSWFDVHEAAAVIYRVTNAIDRAAPNWGFRIRTNSELAGGSERRGIHSDSVQ